MAQPAHIELQTGPDRFYRAAVWALWLIAATVAIAQMHVLAWPLTAAVCGLLILLRPGMNHPVQRSCSLRLYLDGSATLGEEAGSWGRYCRCCRWYAVLLIDLPQRTERVLVSAHCNGLDDYRRLLLWTRFAAISEVGDIQPWRLS
jgi:hypothetical protein